MTGDRAASSELFQLDRATCLTLLRAQHVGRLVLTSGEPAVLPVNYVLASGAITFRTAVGSPADVGADRPVMFEVDMFDERTRSGWSVVVRGRLMAVSTDEPTPQVDTWAPGERDRPMAVSVDVVTGRLLRGAVAEPTDRPGGYL